MPTWNSTIHQIAMACERNGTGAWIISCFMSNWRAWSGIASRGCGSCRPMRWPESPSNTCWAHLTAIKFTRFRRVYIVFPSNTRCRRTFQSGRTHFTLWSSGRSGRMWCTMYFLKLFDWTRAWMRMGPRRRWWNPCRCKTKTHHQRQTPAIWREHSAAGHRSVAH